MKCKEIHNQINPYLSGLLDEEKAKLFQAHLDECVLCKQLVNEVSATMISAEGEEKLIADPFLSIRLLQIIENRKESKLLSAFQRFLQPVAMAGLLFVGAYLGIGLGNNYATGRDSLMNAESEALVADFLFNDIDFKSIEIFLLEENN